MTIYPPSVRIVEVGPRDGLQNEKMSVPTADKIRFVNLLSESGLPVIEATSFVSPKSVPQLSDGDQVLRGISRKAGVSYPVLVPNLLGLERALAAGASEIAIFTAASELFNQHNINASIAESLLRFEPVMKRAKAELKLWVRGYVSTCFRCPYELKEDPTKKIDPQKVFDVVQKLIDMGVDEISLGDTIGAAEPDDVARLLDILLKRFSVDQLAVHFHDTYHFHERTLKNVRKALEMGIWIVDSSAGGLGGCPYAPGASGNLATEDLIHMLHGMKIDTGVDLAKVTDASRFISSVLRRPLTSRYLQSGA